MIISLAPSKLLSKIKVYWTYMYIYWTATCRGHRAIFCGAINSEHLFTISQAVCKSFVCVNTFKPHRNPTLLLLTIQREKNEAHRGQATSLKVTQKVIGSRAGILRNRYVQILPLRNLSYRIGGKIYIFFKNCDRCTKIPTHKAKWKRQSAKEQIEYVDFSIRGDKKIYLLIFTKRNSGKISQKQERWIPTKTGERSGREVGGRDLSIFFVQFDFWKRVNTLHIQKQN